MSRLAKIVAISGTVSLLISVILCKVLAGWFIWKAEIAITIRPGLLELNWWEAFWSGHFTEWLWVLNPSQAYWYYVVAITIALLTVALPLFDAILDRNSG